LLAATTAIVSFARVAVGMAPAVNSDDAQLLAFCSSILWVAIVAFCSRFLLGRNLANAGGMWCCPNCKYLNQPYAVICTSLRQQYSAKS
jgi:hypothetical protein